jgi:hypothetical protein
VYTGAADAGVLRRAASAALDILGAPWNCGSSSEALCLEGPHRVPRGLVDQLAQTARERSEQALTLAPDDPESLLLYGDFEWWYAMPLQKHHGELRCWPSSGVDAYERARAAGAAGAAPRRAGLARAARLSRVFADTRVETCSGQTDRRLDVELVKATVEQGNSAWSNAIGRYGDAGSYPHYFAGRWLDERTAEVAELRRNRQYRQARLTSLEFGGVSFADDASASVETAETWDDKTCDEGGAVVRDASGRLRQRYDLRKLDGVWKIVDGAILRE